MFSVSLPQTKHQGCSQFFLNICERIGCFKELTESKCSTLIGCHKYNKLKSQNFLNMKNNLFFIYKTLALVENSTVGASPSYNYSNKYGLITRKTLYCQNRCELMNYKWAISILKATLTNLNNIQARTVFVTMWLSDTFGHADIQLSQVNFFLNIIMQQLSSWGASYFRQLLQSERVLASKSAKVSFC